MKHLVFAVTLFASILFFSVTSILGVSVASDSESTPLYKIYCAVVFVLFTLYYFGEYAGKRRTKQHVISFAILAFYVISGALSGYVTDTSMLVLVAFGLPASGVAIYYAEHANLGQLIKWIDVLLPVISVSLLFSLKQLLVEISEGTSFYSQNLSYYAAYCFILYLFFLFFGNKYDRFSFFKRKIYKYISVLMLPYSMTILFFSGGRGALGTLVVGIVILFYLYNKNVRTYKINIFRLCVFMAIISSLLYMFIPDDAKNVLDLNYTRAFSFFDSNKDMYDRTSGRDEVFKFSLDQIEEHPILGSGIFSYKKDFTLKSEQPYPHNLFLEVLLQGGVLFFLLFSGILLLLLLKLYRILKVPQQEFVAIITVFCMTMLMYSGSYIQNSFFWFFVFYVYNFSIKKCKSGVT